MASISKIQLLDGSVYDIKGKVENAIAGNFAGLDENGNLTDSGKSAEDFAGAIYKTATPGSIVSIDDGADNLPIKELKVGIEPVQDLHGYDHPWPAGGGKNLLPPFSSFTENGVTATVASDGTITLNGTATSNVSKQVAVSLPAGDYCFSLNNDVAIGTGAATSVYFYAADAGGSWVMNPICDVRNVVGRGTSENGITVTRMVINSGVTLNDFVIKPQLESGSTATAYEPYSNICPISGWTGAKVSRAGKNLLPNSAIDTSTNGITFTVNSDRSITINGTATANTDIIVVRPATCVLPKGATLIVSGGYSESVFFQCAIDGNTPTSRGEDVRVTTTNGSITGNCYVRVLSGTVCNNVVVYPMLRLSSETDATYEPYQGETYDITFPSEAGTVYGGSLDVSNGVLTVDRAIAEFDGSSDEIWGWHISGVAWTFVRGGVITNYITQFDALTLCDKLQPCSWAARGRKDNSCGMYYGASYIFIKSTNSITDVATAKTWLADNPITVMYPLATHITYQLTAQEVRTLLGVNNIWADTGDITELIYPVNTDTAMALYEKADKVVNATAGNFAALDAEGNLKDSGKKPSDFLTQHQDISGKLDKDQGFANAGKFMKIGADGNLVPDTIPDPSNKADKVQNAVAGNFAGLDANGNLTDSGKKAGDFLDKNYDSGWKAKTWSGLSIFNGNNIWTDGENIYYSYSSSQYILDKSTSTWLQKTWAGTNPAAGSAIWTDGENIYYSSGSEQYILDKSTSTWLQKTWSGMTNFYGERIWTDGENIYFNNKSNYDSYVLDKSTSTWNTKSWNGSSNIDGTYIWTDGEDIYYSYNSNQYILDKSTSTWNNKTWNGMTNFNGFYIWNDRENIYYSYDGINYILDKANSTWLPYSFDGGLLNYRGNYIWSDGENIYYSNNSIQYILDNKPKLYLGQDGEFSPVPVKKFIDENVPAYSFAYDTANSALVITIPN